MPAPGTSWATNSWTVNSWAAGTWADLGSGGAGGYIRTILRRLAFYSRRGRR